MSTIESYLDGLKGVPNTAAKRIELFNAVRDITYKIVPNIRNSCDGPDAILKLGCGSCTPKHFLLGRLFESLDIPVGYVTYPFHWNAQNIAYPQRLCAASENLPYETHLAIKAKIDGRWVLVDATWDLGLEGSGLPINKNWDGASDTLLAVDAIDAIEHASAVNRDRYVVEIKTGWTADEHRRMFDFYKLFNGWLDEVRKRQHPSTS